MSDRSSESGPRPTSAEATLRLSIDGMHCSSCVGHVEKALQSVEGVVDASVSLADSSARVSGSGVSSDRLVEAVVSAGFEAEPIATRRSLAQERAALDARITARLNRWRTRMIVGLLVWLSVSDGMFTSGTGFLPGWLKVSLITIAFFYVGSAFFASAWSALRARSSNMDTLVSIGALSAYLYSVVLVALHRNGIALEHPVYFMESIGLLSFISIGHYLEARTTAAAGGALRSLLELQPDDVLRVNPEDGEEGRRVATSLVAPGDLIRVRPGDRIAVDGIIRTGRAAIDESSLTGEPLPVDRVVGDEVVAGSVDTDGVLVVEASTHGDETTLSRIIEIVLEAQSSKTRMQRLADRIASVFVPIVLVISALTFLGWWSFGGEDALVHAIVYSVTVLVIACPCALGLATPTAVMAGSGAASLQGILVRSSVALERAALVERVCFDKTGTLTEGRPVVKGCDDDLLRDAASLAAGSNHPLSVAVVEAARERGVSFTAVDDLSEQAGVGLRGTIEGAAAELCSASSATARGIVDPERIPEGLTASVLVVDGRVRGVIVFDDRIRDEAASVIAALRRDGREISLLTGDRRGVAETVAASVGIDSKDVHAELTPEGKLAFVAESDRTIAMVGDGINDAAALSEAAVRGGVGIAIGAGTNVAIESADIVLPGDRVEAVLEALRIARSTRRAIRQNLTLSFFYNTCAIPVAAFGLLGDSGPLIAGIAMGLSSVSVVANSLRLRLSLRSR
ncbi:MAG: copper-translocating P-type ATPase [Phycisphaerae bacterium]|nr:copper-translocating P-type ATPase [Phycisphaerae bacterium]HAW95702.1 hypothetical protein [Phycisphaerales bacterium]